MAIIRLMIITCVFVEVRGETKLLYSVYLCLTKQNKTETLTSAVGHMNIDTLQY
jgi:hypothetical protein